LSIANALCKGKRSRVTGTCKWVRSTNQAGYTLHTHKISLSALLEIKALQVLVTEESITTVLLLLLVRMVYKTPTSSAGRHVGPGAKARGCLLFGSMPCRLSVFGLGAACSPLVCWTVQLMARARCEEMQETH
jgi:hypothetical protein